MTATRAREWKLTAACVAVVGLWGCGAQSADTAHDVAVPASSARRPVTLPDLSTMVESVQRQLRDRHALLTRLAAAPETPPATLAEAYGEMGKLLMAAQYGLAAESSFLNAQALSPDDVRWPYYLAHLARTGGDVAKARLLFARAVEIRPDDVAARVWLGEMALAMGEPDVAESQFARALELQPNSLSARFGLGRAAQARGQPQEAVRLFEDVLARDATAAAVHYPLSLAYRAVGDTAKAERHLRQRREHEILPADPLMVALDALLESPQTYERLGIQALNREAWAEAEELFRKGLALAPTSAALHQRLGTALRMRGDDAGAEREFVAAVEADPKHFPAQYSLGVVRQAQGRHAESIRRFEAALAEQATYTEARVRLAASLRRVGRATEALAAYAQVLASDANSVEARLGQAMSLVQLARYHEARETLEEATRTHPEQPLFAHALARLLATAPQDRVRDGPRAVAMTQALVARGRTLELGETLAMALAEVGQFEQAVSIQRTLVAAAEQAGLAAPIARLTANLRLYESGQPCRTPWAPDEML
jgi:tetratricopeptide (TPR) repeat protein